MPKRMWAVAHYQRRLNQRGHIIYFKQARKPGYKRRMLFQTWTSAQRYSMRQQSRHWMAVVYRIGKKPVRVYTITLGKE